MKYETTLEVKVNKEGVSFLIVDKELYRVLLRSARVTQKGRRGLSSRKIRVRKKIIKDEINVALLRGIELDKKERF